MLLGRRRFITPLLARHRSPVQMKPHPPMLHPERRTPGGFIQPFVNLLEWFPEKSN